MTFVGIHREEKNWSNRHNPLAIPGRHVDRAHGGLRFAPVSFLTVRVHVLNDTLEEAFRAMHPSFQPPKCPPVPA